MRLFCLFRDFCLYLWLSFVHIFGFYLFIFQLLIQFFFFFWIQSFARSGVVSFFSWVHIVQLFVYLLLSFVQIILNTGCGITFLLIHLV